MFLYVSLCLSEWTFECATCRMQAWSGGFLISPYSLQPSISEAGCAKVLCSFTWVFAASLSLSLSLFLSPPVWRLRNDTRQVTVVTLWGIGCCQPLCKPAWAWRSSPQCPQRLQTQAWPWKTNLYQKKDGSPLPAQRDEWRMRGVHTVYLYCVLFIEDVGEW